MIIWVGFFVVRGMLDINVVRVLVVVICFFVFTRFIVFVGKYGIMKWKDCVKYFGNVYRIDSCLKMILGVWKFLMKMIFFFVIYLIFLINKFGNLLGNVFYWIVFLYLILWGLEFVDIDRVWIGGLWIVDFGGGFIFFVNVVYFVIIFFVSVVIEGCV